MTPAPYYLTTIITGNYYIVFGRGSYSFGTGAGKFTDFWSQFKP